MQRTLGAPAAARRRPDAGRHRYVITGAAGFLGSHLCEALLRSGHEVVGLDDLSSGRRGNLSTFSRHPSFSFRQHDVEEPLPVHGPVDGVFHLISPSHAFSDIEGRCVAVSRVPTGTESVAAFARQRRARLLVVAAVGDAYADPFDDTAPEADALSELDVDLRIARLFNAYGPRMEEEDEPTVMQLLLQAVTGQPISCNEPVDTPRSFCFVSDLIGGMLRLFQSSIAGHAVDLGDPAEHTVGEIATSISEIVGVARPVERSRAVATTAHSVPDLSIATEELGWAPRVSLDAGLASTARWLREELGPTVGVDTMQRRSA